MCSLGPFCVESTGIVVQWIAGQYNCQPTPDQLLIAAIETRRTSDSSVTLCVNCAWESKRTWRQKRPQCPAIKQASRPISAVNLASLRASQYRRQVGSRLRINSTFSLARSWTVSETYGGTILNRIYAMCRPSRVLRLNSMWAIFYSPVRWPVTYYCNTKAWRSGSAIFNPFTPISSNVHSLNLWKRNVYMM